MKSITRFSVLTVLAMSVSQVGWTMQALDDESLAQTTGQDGVSISVGSVGGNGLINFDHIDLEDTDGFGTTYTSPAAISYRTTSANPADRGVGFYSGAAGTTPIETPIVVTIDADDNNANPVLNANISLDSSLTRINLSPFTLSLTASGASQRDLIRVGGTGIDILLNEGSALGFNMQLGNEPQGHMFVFTGGQITQIKNDENSPIEVMSYEGNSATSSLKFNFDLKANAASTNGIQLAGAYIDVEAGEGLTFGKSGAFDKFDVALNDVVMGSEGTGNTSFNSIENGSLGNIGAVGVSISDLEINIKGM